MGSVGSPVVAGVEEVDRAGEELLTALGADWGLRELDLGSFDAFDAEKGPTLVPSLFSLFLGSVLQTCEQGRSSKQRHARGPKSERRTINYSLLCNPRVSADAVVGKV